MHGGYASFLGAGGRGIGYYEKMSRPLVSVIVGVYNKQRDIEECLRSVLAQSVADLELIVIDDGSSDRGVSVVQAIQDSRIQLIRHQPNSGLPAIPRNIGIRQAQGDYIAFLDADDLWMPNKLQQQIAYMEAHPEYPLTHTQCGVVNEAGEDLYLRHEGGLLPSGEYLHHLLEHCTISISSVVATKKLVADVGLFNEGKWLKAREDYEWLLRAAALTPFGLISDCLTQYRASDDSISHVSGNWKSTPRDFLSHWDSLQHSDRWGGRVSIPELKEMAAIAAEENAYYWRQRRHFRKTAWFAYQLIRLAPLSGRGWRQLVSAGLRRGA